MKHLVGKSMTRKIKFMGEDVVIKKLSVSEIMEVQEKAKEQKEGDEIATLRTIIRLGADGAKDLSDEELQEFPLEELTNLTTEIIKFSGMGALLGKEAETGN